MVYSPNAMRKIEFSLVILIRFQSVAKNVVCSNPKELEEFWQRYGGVIPTWNSLFQQMKLYTTSSASVERLISVFTDTISDDMISSKESTIEARCLFRYNHRNPSARPKHRFDD